MLNDVFQVAVIVLSFFFSINFFLAIPRWRVYKQYSKDLDAWKVFCTNLVAKNSHMASHDEVRLEGIRREEDILSEIADNIDKRGYRE